MNLKRTLFAAAFVAAASVACADLKRYTITDLSIGNPYDETLASGLNNLGEVAGTGFIESTGELHAFIWRDGVFQDLGIGTYSSTTGIGINDSDQLAVTGYTPGYKALRYSNGQFKKLGSVDGGSSEGYSINKLGNIVGSAINGDGGRVGFSWINGVFSDLSPMGIIRAWSLNDNNDFAGTSGYYWQQGNYVYGVYHPFCYIGGVFRDLGTLTGNPRINAEAFGINNAGQVVGYSASFDNRLHAFLYSNGQMNDLGTMQPNDAMAIGINSAGLIVGNIQNPYGAPITAFLYSNNAMQNLRNLIIGGQNWSQLQVSAINDKGMIVGNGVFNGMSRGFLLRPIKPVISPITP